MKPEVQAAWVQAIGSIAAILLAVAVPAIQHRLASKERQRQKADLARSLGLMLLPAIQDFGERNNLLWMHEDPDDNVEDLDANSCIAGPVTRAALDVPEAVSKRIHELHDLGPAAEGLQQAVFNVTAARDLMVVRRIDRATAGGNKISFPEHVIYDKRQFYDLMWGALQGLTDCQNRIESAFTHRARPQQLKKD
ncbi:hypothetical protein I5U65_14750 [Stenotrophomonas maltophilia]|nr:hypothetical protein [Stenotrophomonas maltophilia]